MNSQELRALQEAYSQVYELDEVSQKTATRAFAARATDEFESDGADYNYTKGGKSKADETKRRIEKKHGKAAGQHAERAAHAKIFGRKKTALTSMPPKPTKTNEEVDLYDIILSHLLDEGYADTEQAAEAIMVNMSEDWRESIVEGRELNPTKVPTIDSPGGAGGRVTIDKPYPATLGGKKGVKSTDERGSEYFMPYKPQGGLPKPSTLPDFDKAQYKNTYTNTYKDIPARQSTKNPQSHLSRTGVPRVHTRTATYGIDN